MQKKRMGRPPSENPRLLRVDVRLSEEEMKLLDEYCKKNNITRPQGLRDGLKALFSK